MDKQLEALMRLGLTAQEDKQVLEDDKRIDRGEKLFELTVKNINVIFHSIFFLTQQVLAISTVRVVGLQNMATSRIFHLKKCKAL